MRVLKTRAVSLIVQFAGGADEKAKPGREGTIMSNAIGVPVEVLEFCRRGSITGKNSRNDPGQP